MDIDFHFVRDRVAAKSLAVSFISSKDQIVDIFIKPLVVKKFYHFRLILNVIDTPLDSMGRLSIVDNVTP